MTDVFSREKRSWLMGRVKGRDTKPEMLVRSIIHRMGFRFRLHRKDLPGKPDIVLPKYKKAVFIHGCFWHGHKNCPRAARPTSNIDFWNRKIDGNIKRDANAQKELKAMSWKILVVWQCQIRDIEALQKRLEGFLLAEV